MDGENNGKPYCLMDDLGGKPTICGNIHIYMQFFSTPNVKMQNFFHLFGATGMFPKIVGFPPNHPGF